MAHWGIMRVACDKSGELVFPQAIAPTPLHDAQLGAFLMPSGGESCASWYAPDASTSVHPAGAARVIGRRACSGDGDADADASARLRMPMPGRLHAAQGHPRAVVRVPPPRRAHQGCGDPARVRRDRAQCERVTRRCWCGRWWVVQSLQDQCEAGDHLPVNKTSE